MLRYGTLWLITTSSAMTLACVTMSAMNDRARINETSGACGEPGHIPPILDCWFPRQLSDGLGVEGNPLDDLSEVLFPYSLNQYPGKWKSFAFLMCMSVGSIRVLSKPSGKTRISLPMILRARKIIADVVLRLSQIDRDLAKLETDRRSRPKRRGMFEVKVRDETGIPRTGLARDGWRKKPGDLPKF